MDGTRFDRVKRLATRRRLLVGWLGATAAAAGAVRGRGAAQPVCRPEGEPCTLWVRCCAGLTCDTSPLNPNSGVCRAGGAAEVETPRPRATRTPQDRNGARGGRDRNGARGGRDRATRTPAPTPTEEAGKPSRRATETPTATATATGENGEGRRRRGKQRG